MLEEKYIDLILAIYSFITICIFIIMYKERAYPKLWVATAISLGIGSFIFIFRHIDQNFRIIGNLFYLLTTLLLGFSILFEYYHKDTKIRKYKSRYYLILLLIVPLFLIAIILGMLQVSLINIIQLSLMTFLFLIAYIMIKLYNKEKSITHILMFFTIIFSFLTLLFSVLHNFDLELCWELAYIMKIMLFATLLLTATSAPIENRRKKTEKKFWTSFNRAEFYKDLFIHDINNMLQIILSAIQILLLDNSTNKNHNKKDYLKLIKNQVYSGSNLIENLRKLSHLDNKEILFEKIEILAILRNVIDHAKEIYKDKNLDIKLETYSNKVYLHANELIREVFENLIINSIEHNDNEEIKVIINIEKIVENTQNFIMIEIIDNGKGIEDNRKKAIFSRAFKKNNDLKGLGLGLSLVYKIISIFNGKIWVEDRIEGDYTQGSKFILLIPKD